MSFVDVTNAVCNYTYGKRNVLQVNVTSTSNADLSLATNYIKNNALDNSYTSQVVDWVDLGLNLKGSRWEIPQCAYFQTDSDFSLTSSYGTAYVGRYSENYSKLYEGWFYGVKFKNVDMWPYDVVIAVWSDNTKKSLTSVYLGRVYFTLSSIEMGTVPVIASGEITRVVKGINDISFLLDTKASVFSDPYEEGGTTGTGGGQGTFSGTGDDIDIPVLPTLSAVDAGFITLFNPSVSQLSELANYMWSNPLFDLNAWKKIFADPMQAILGLSIVPVDVPSGGAKEVTVGNISTGISITKAATQFVSVDCGTLNVEEYWGAYLDYEPYTKAEIYLPYIGIHPISVDDIMGKPVHVVYNIDILTGGCTAFIQCGNSVLYQFIGQCAISIPITGDNWTNAINGAISIAGDIGSMVATGGASAPMAMGSIASTMVNQMKPSVEKSGAMGGPGGMLGVQTPYLILTRPRQALPERQNTFTGYPSFITMKLSDCSGYTEIESVHLENISATEQELSEIESLLKGGVIL